MTDNKKVKDNKTKKVMMRMTEEDFALMNKNKTAGGYTSASEYIRLSIINGVSERKLVLPLEMTALNVSLGVIMEIVMDLTKEGSVYRETALKNSKRIYETLMPRIEKLIALESIEVEEKDGDEDEEDGGAK